MWLVSVFDAVKELSALADEDTRRMAVNEIKIANRHAKHAEHLVKTVDAYFHNDKICIAMEFADGVRSAACPAWPTRRAARS